MSASRPFGFLGDGDPDTLRVRSPKDRTFGLWAGFIRLGLGKATFRLTLIPILTVAASSASSTAQDASPAPNNAVIQVIGKKDPSQRLICQREMVTGSIVARRVCRSQAEVDQLRREAQGTIAELQRHQETAEHLRNARAEAGPN